MHTDRLTQYRAHSYACDAKARRGGAYAREWKRLASIWDFLAETINGTPVTSINIQETEADKKTYAKRT